MSVSLPAMPEVIEKVVATRELFESALQKYLDACSALRDSSLARELSPIQLDTFTSTELTRFKSYELKLHQAKALVGSSKNMLRPVRALPPEVLSRIFHLIPSERHANSKNYLLFPRQLEHLSHVCSHWRQVTLDTPLLWSFIRLAPQNAANKRLLQRARVYAARADGLPLQIHIAEYEQVKNLPDDSGLPDTDEDLMRFLTSVSHQIYSIELVAPLRPLEFYAGLLGTCLAGAAPGVLTQLDINNTAQLRSRELALFGSAEELSLTKNLALDVSAQHLENLLGPVTRISLRDIKPSWTSKAFHGLTELRLLLGQSSTKFMIDESDLCRVLSASPKLRVLVFSVPLGTRHPRNNPPTRIKLEDLEVLDLGPSYQFQLETMLEIVAPGSKMSVMRIDLHWVTAHELHPDSKIYRFLSHTTAPRLVLSYMKSLTWLDTFSHMASRRVSTLVIDRLLLIDAADIPATQQMNSPPLLYGADNLYLTNSQVPLHQLYWILERYRVHTLTLWQCHVCSDSKTRIENDGLVLAMSQKCAVVNILEHKELNLRWY